MVINTNLILNNISDTKIWIVAKNLRSYENLHYLSQCRRCVPPLLRDHLGRVGHRDRLRELLAHLGAEDRVAVGSTPFLANLRNYFNISLNQKILYSSLLVFYSF